MRIHRLLLVGALLLPACAATPEGGDPPPSGEARACRTELDCAAGEVCAAEQEGVVCRQPKADDPEAAAGPAGQPPPPVGLLEGAGRPGQAGGSR